MSTIAEFATVVTLVIIVLAPRLIELYLNSSDESSQA